MNLATIISFSAILMVLLAVIYLFVLAVASVRRPSAVVKQQPSTRFAIAIPAHWSFRNLYYPTV